MEIEVDNSDKPEEIEKDNINKEVNMDKPESKLPFSIENLLSDKYKSYKEVKKETGCSSDYYGANASNTFFNSEAGREEISDDDDGAVDDESDHSENVDVESGSTVSLEGYDNCDMKTDHAGELD